MIETLKDFKLMTNGRIYQTTRILDGVFFYPEILPPPRRPGNNWKVEEETIEILDFLLDVDTDKLTQIHQDNVREYLGERILFKTKGLFTIGKIIRISKSNCAIGIENIEDKEESAHKKNIKYPKIKRWKTRRKE